MSQEERSDIILRPGRPAGGLFGRSFTVGPYQVGIVIIDGELQPPFTEDSRTLPRGRQVETYVASTAPFNLVFWLDDPSDTARPAQGLSLDQPVLTADGQPVTGRIELSFSVIPEHAARLLRLRRMDADEIRARDVSNAIKGELVAKVLALELFRFTSDELRGNRRPLQDIYGSTQTELASTFTGYGLRLDNFNVSWGLTLQEQEKIKEDRHRSAVRDVEREGELEQARWRGEPSRSAEPSEPGLSSSGEKSDEPAPLEDTEGAGNHGPGEPPKPDNKGEQPWRSFNPRWALALTLVAAVGLVGALVYFTVFDPPSDTSEEMPVAIQDAAPTPTLPPAPVPTLAPTESATSSPIIVNVTIPTPSPILTPESTVVPTPTPASISTARSAVRTRGDLSCFEPCSQRSDPLEASFDNFLVEARFTNPTGGSGFEYGFSFSGVFRNGISEQIEIMVANDRTWRAFIRKSYSESAPPNVDLRQVEIDGGEIPAPFVNTGAGSSNRLEATVLGDEGCLYINGIFVSCFDLSNRALTREIAVSSMEGDVRYDGFRAREAQAGT